MFKCKCTCANCKNTVLYSFNAHNLCKKLVLPHFPHSKRDWNFGWSMCLQEVIRLFSFLREKKNNWLLPAKLQPY